jgi:hypothetical protein
MKSYLIPIITATILFMSCDKDTGLPKQNLNTEEMLFNEGQLLLDDSLILMHETTRFDKQIDLTDTLNDRFGLYFGAGLVLTIYKPKDSTSFSGDYVFSADLTTNFIIRASVFTDLWDNPNSNGQYGDYDMLQGTLTIDTISARYEEYPENAPRPHWYSKYYQYFQEIEVTFNGVLVEKPYTLNYGNEKIDTIPFSGFYKGFFAYTRD